MLAGLLLMPAGAYCETGLPGPQEALLKEIEAYHAALLPQTKPPHPMTLRFEPRLKAIKAAAVAAQTDSELLGSRAKFEGWKSAALYHLYSAASAAGVDAENEESLDQFRARKAQEAAFIIAKRHQVTADRVSTHAAPIRSLIAGARATPSLWSLFFDGSAPKPVAVAAEVPFAVNGSSRYNKVRALMISQGAPASCVDKTIKESLLQGVDPALALSVVWQESRCKAGATSASGARGLMQLMPSTAKDMGVSNANMLYDEDTNLRAGIKYLRWVTGYLNLNVSLADITTVATNKIRAILASYNAGIGNVKKWLRHQGQDLSHIPFAETRQYVNSIGGKLSNLIGSLSW